MAKKILIADDDPQICQLISDHISSHGYIVITAKDGVEAFQKSKQEKPDLIILDNLMPKVSGYQFVEQLRPYDDELKKIPVIILCDKETMKHFFDGAKIRCFLTKPVDLDALLKQINLIVGPAEEMLEGCSKNNVVLSAVDEFMIKRLTSHLRSIGYEVHRAWNEDEAVKYAKSVSPRFVITQFWEEPHKFDTAKIYEDLKAETSTLDIPFLTFCSETLSLDAMKHIPKSSIFTFSNSTELIKKLDEYLKNQNLLPV